MKCLGILALVLTVILVAGMVYAQQPFGPTDPVTAPGKPVLSVGYFYGEDKWDSDVLFTDLKSKVHELYLQLGYGLAPGLEVYLRGGAVNAKVAADQADFKDNAKAYGGIGLRGCLFSTKGFSIGAFGNFTYYSEWKDRIDTTIEVGGGLLPINASVKIKDHYEVNAGIAGQIKPTKNLIIYGGPYCRYAHAKLSADFDAGESNSETIDLKQNFGAFLGVRVPASKQVSFDAEAQISRYYSAGIQLNFAF